MLSLYFLLYFGVSFQYLFFLPLFVFLFSSLSSHQRCCEIVLLETNCNWYEGRKRFSVFKEQQLIEDCQKAEQICFVQFLFLNCSKFCSFVMLVTLMYKLLLDLDCHFFPWYLVKGSNKSEGEPVLLQFPSFWSCNSSCLTGALQNFVPAVTAVHCCDSLLADFLDVDFFSPKY